MELELRRSIIRGLRTQNEKKIQEYLQIIWKIIQEPFTDITFYLFNRRDRFLEVNLDDYSDYFKYEYFKYILLNDMCHKIFENGDFFLEVVPFFKGLTLKINLLILQKAERKSKLNLFYELLNEDYHEDISTDSNENYRLEQFLINYFDKRLFKEFLESQIEKIEDKEIKKVLELWEEGYKLNIIAELLNISIDLAYKYKQKGLAKLRVPFLIFIFRET